MIFPDKDPLILTSPFWTYSSLVGTGGSIFWCIEGGHGAPSIPTFFETQLFYSIFQNQQTRNAETPSNGCCSLQRPRRTAPEAIPEQLGELRHVVRQLRLCHRRHLLREHTSQRFRPRAGVARADLGLLRSGRRGFERGSLAGRWQRGSG